MTFWTCFWTLLQIYFFFPDFPLDLHFDDDFLALPDLPEVFFADEVMYVVLVISENAGHSQFFCFMTSFSITFVFASTLIFIVEEGLILVVMILLVVFVLDSTLTFIVEVFGG